MRRRVFSRHYEFKMFKEKKLMKTNNRCEGKKPQN